MASFSMICVAMLLSSVAAVAFGQSATTAATAAAGGSFTTAAAAVAAAGSTAAAASGGSAPSSRPQCQMNGKSYDVGSMFDGTDAFYYCKLNGANGVTAEAIGCINDGQRVYDLALYQKGDNFYCCRAGDTTVSSDLWGCALKGSDGSVTPKSIACTWDVGTDPVNYVQSCVQKGGTAVITQVYCLYTYRGGRIQINAGCYRVFPDSNGGVAAGCTRNGDGTTLTLTTWPAKDSTTAAAAPQASGLYECPINSRK